MAAVDLFENRLDAADALEFDRLAEALDGGEVAKTIFGAEIRHFQDSLERARPAHDFAENRADGVRVERPFAGLEHVVEDFLFPCGGKDFGALVVFDLADFAGDGGALVDELEDVQVQFIDLRAQALERTCRTTGRGRVRAALALARHVSYSGRGSVR